MRVAGARVSGPHGGTRVPGDFGGAIGRAIVEDVNGGARQGLAEIFHDLADRALLVKARHQDGYVLDPWGFTSIAGWRKSLDRVAAFYFTSLPDSYAARTGRPDNVGVIGLALFRERSHCCARRDCRS